MKTFPARALLVALALLLCTVPGGPSGGWSGSGEVQAATQKQKQKPKKAKKAKPAKPAKTATPKAPDKPKESWQLPMKVVIVRSSDPACEPSCPEWIMAEGEITPSTPAAFRKVLKQLGKRKLPVILHSPGGRIDAAMEVGRLIRKNKLATAVGRTEYRGCGPYDPSCKLPKNQKGVYAGSIVASGSYCASACPLILAGGAERLANGESRIGVHQIRTESSREWVRYRETYRIVNGKKKVISRKVVSRKVVQGKTTYGINKSMWKRLAAYATEMGVSPELVDDMNSARHDSLYFLTVDRRKKLALVTRIESAASLSNRYACKIGSGAGTACVTREDFAPKPAPSAAAAAPVDGKAALQRVGIPPDAKPMTVVIVRNSSQNCEPLCPQWIAARGVITPDTPKLFKAVFDRMGDLKLPVAFDSPGGDFDGGLEIGRMIRERGLDALIVTTAFIRCAPEEPGCTPAGGQFHKGFTMFGTAEPRCDGACLFAAVGAIKLTSVAKEIVVYVPSLYQPRGDKRHPAVQLMLHFARMGIDKGLLARLQDPKTYDRIALDAKAQASTLHAITPNFWTGSTLEPAACKEEARPSFCVRLGSGS